MPRKVYVPGAFERIWIYMTSFFTLAKIVPEMNSWQTDLKAQEIRKFKGEEQGPVDTCTNKFYGSKSIPFDKIVKCYKQYQGMTFNDFMLAIIGKSYKQWFEHYGVMDTENVMIGIAVNLRNLPSGYHNLVIHNRLAASKILLPTSKDLSSTMNKIKPIIKRLTTTKVLYSALVGIYMMPYLPRFMSEAILGDYSKGMDTSSSNFQFSKRAFVFKGK